MHIIDPHVHVWHRDPAYPWAKETARPPDFDATPEMLLELMAAHGVERTVLLQYIGYRWDNSFVADTLKRYPKEFMGVARVNPEDPAAPDHLSSLTEEQGFRGVRLSPAVGAAGDWFTGPLMDPLFSRAEAQGVPMLILTKPTRLADLAPLVERHPDLDVVIDHMADCAIDDASGLDLLLGLARYPRVYVKISHTWGVTRESYPWRDTHNLVRQVYEAYGGPRCMWGTDWPVSTDRAEYGQTLSVVRDEMDFITTQDMPWVLGKTALKLWPFDLED